jgi:hypothetical protein
MKSFCIAASAAICVCFAGCAAPGTAPKITIPTPQQLVTDFCPVVNADLKMLAVSPLLNASQQLLLNGTPSDPSKPGIIAMNNAVCAAGGQINVADLQQFNATAFPALIGLVAALPMIPDQPAILLGLTVAQPILTQIINSLPVAAPAAPASAPVASSAPLVAAL